MGCWQGLSCWSIKAPKLSILSFIQRISLCAAFRVSQQSCFSFAILSLRWPLVLASFLIGVPKLILLAFLKETGFMVASLGSLPYQPYLMMSNFSFSVLFSREMFSIEWLFESYLSTNFLYLSNQNRQFSSLRFTFSYRLDYPRQRRSSSPRLSVCSN